MAARPSRSDPGEPVPLPNALVSTAVDFDRHVASLFGRLGCNTGACHGSFQGRGGLNLSLFGHDPARDFTHAHPRALGPSRRRRRPRSQPHLAQADRPGSARRRAAVHGSARGSIGSSAPGSRGGAGAIRRGRPSSGSRSARAILNSNGRAARRGSRSSRGSAMATNADVTPSATSTSAMTPSRGWQRRRRSAVCGRATRPSWPRTTASSLRRGCRCRPVES